MALPPLVSSGQVVAASHINSIRTALGSWSFAVNAGNNTLSNLGPVTGTSATFTGTVTAASFSGPITTGGAVTAATGSFSGAVSAASVTAGTLAATSVITITKSSPEIRMMADANKGIRLVGAADASTVSVQLTTNAFGAAVTALLADLSGNVTIAGSLICGGDVKIANNSGATQNTFRIDGSGNALYIVGDSSAGAATGTQIIFRTAPAGSVGTDRMNINSIGGVTMASAGGATFDCGLIVQNNNPSANIAAGIVRIVASNDNASNACLVCGGSGGYGMIFYADGLLSLGNAYNHGRLGMGSYRLWVDGAGKLRIKNGEPVSDLDGVTVGSQ
jgi:hypothetical protein